MVSVHAVPLCPSEHKYFLAWYPTLLNSFSISLEPYRHTMDNVFDQRVYILLHLQPDVLDVWIQVLGHLN